MEKLKSTLPDKIKRAIELSGPEDLLSTCSALLDFCLQSPHFQKIVGDLAGSDTALCGKNVEGALDLKREGNELFGKGEYASAVQRYSQAIRVAPMDAEEVGKNLLATLYVNRASSLYKMDLLAECLRDCNRAVVISPNYAKAWYRRGVTNAKLENDHHAAHDFELSMILEPTSSGKQRVQSELKAIRDRCRTRSSSDIHNDEKSVGFRDDQSRVKLCMVQSPTKGRGMTTETDVPEATLVHTEQPYTVIILKQFRDTHCHFCLNELPADVIPCPSCSIPVYCSQDCQVQATGEIKGECRSKNTIRENIPGNLLQYISEVTLTAKYKLDDKGFYEHRHECKGVNWSAVLPPDIVMAGRILMKSLYKGKHSVDNFEHHTALDISHNYALKTPEDKLEFHIYATVLLSCLQPTHEHEISTNRVLAQLVILISQIKVNSMAVVRMKSTSFDSPLKDSRPGGILTSNLEQVSVGQAIYVSGSLFNHSCQPNVHAYFISRTLFVRSTKFIAADCPLELSYGPQVGQWDLKDRQQCLMKEYSFECQCSGCSELNLSDLFINALHCADQNCDGVVLENDATEYERKRLKGHQPFPGTSSSNLLRQWAGAYSGSESWEVLHDCMKTKTSRFSDTDNIGCHLLGKLCHEIKSEYCLMCGSYLDLNGALATANGAGIYTRRLQDAIASQKVPSGTLQDAMRSFELLKSALHKYNKRIAEVSDILSQAFCLTGDLQSALSHCQASVLILAKLYGPDHIVIAHELGKLSSIQLANGDGSYVDTISRLRSIVSRYYGSHADIIFPQLESLR